MQRCNFIVELNCADHFQNLWILSVYNCCRCVWHGRWIGGCSDNGSGPGTLCHCWLCVRCMEGGALPTSNAVQEAGLRGCLILSKYVLQYTCTFLFFLHTNHSLIFCNLLSCLIIRVYSCCTPCSIQWFFCYHADLYWSIEWYNDNIMPLMEQYKKVQKNRSIQVFR